MEIKRWKISKIWTYSWIPGYHTLQSLTGMIVDEMLNANMSSLIDTITKWWNINKVRLVKAQFNPKIVAMILKTKPTHRQVDLD